MMLLINLMKRYNIWFDSLKDPWHSIVLSTMLIIPIIFCTSSSIIHIEWLRIVLCYIWLIFMGISRIVYLWPTKEKIKKE